jgi:hypothetical protein
MPEGSMARHLKTQAIKILIANRGNVGNAADGSYESMRKISKMVEQALSQVTKSKPESLMFNHSAMKASLSDSI